MVPPAPTSAAASVSQSSDSNEVLFEALYDFTTTDEGDLPFKMGDVIRASADQNLDDDWLAGFLNGVGGWFPRNYTKRIDNKCVSILSLLCSFPLYRMYNDLTSDTHGLE